MKNKITLMLTLLLAVFSLQISFAQDGTNDPTFNPTDAGFGNGVDGPIGKVAVQPDGKLIIAGNFNHYNKVARQCIARIYADKSLDISFDSHFGANSHIENVILQADGKIIIVGNFTEYAGVSRNRIARLNADGSLDATFNPGAGANDIINRAVIQPDGKIIIGGNFTTYNNANVYRFTRLNSDGSLDATFTNTLGTNGVVYALAVQADGKILVGGNFTQFNTSFRNNIVRVNADGSRDTSFNIGIGANNVVRNFAVQSDDKIYVLGFFDKFNDQQKSGLVRLNSNGSIDDSFIGSGVGGAASAAVIQPDGKIIIGGSFANYENELINDVIRINNDGTLDSTFNTKPPINRDGAILDVALTAEGKIIAAGLFRQYDNKTNNYIVTLDSTGLLDAAFDIGTGTGSDNSVSVMVSLPDNTILIAGKFNHYNGVHKGKIAKISNDGILDLDFNTGIGANGDVNIITVQADGKILIAGEFSSYSGIARNKIARLNEDGSLDESYNPGAYIVAGNISNIVLQDSGKAILAGQLSYDINDTPHNEYVSRFNIDGSYDFTFNSLLVDYANGFVAGIQEVIVQKNGKLVVGLTGNSFSPSRVNSVFRLNKDGGIDEAFSSLPVNIIKGVWDMDQDASGNIFLFGNAPGGVTTFERGMLVKLDKDGKVITDFNVNGSALTNSLRINKLKVQDNGKIIISGTFNYYDGVEMNGLGRLNPDGSVDDTFSSAKGFTTYNRGVSDILLRSENKIIIGGTFKAYNYVGRNNIARLNSTGALNVKTTLVINESIMVYKTNNSLTVTSSNKNIASVAVYDLLGRLVASKKAVNAATALFKDLHLASTVLIINTTLDDGSTVSKKVYY
jgi:uncharacterized delta-60 repeat protein